MKHSDVQDHMADYLEGDLPLERRALFDAHLDDCEACLSEIREVQRTITLLRSLPEPRVPSGFTESVMRRVRENEGRQSLVENLREAFGILLSPRILVPVSVSMIALGIIVGNDKIEDALLLESQRAPSAASDPSAGGPVIAGIPGAGNSARAKAPNRGGRPSTLQITIQSGLASDVRPGPTRQGAPEAIDFARIFRAPSSLAEQRFVSQAPGVLKVAAPNQGWRQDRFDFSPLGSSSSASRQPSAEAWLARLRRNPADFALVLGNFTLAEQELWIANLARHAVVRGELDDIVSMLRRSPNKRAQLLAEDFAAVGRGPIADGASATNRD